VPAHAAAPPAATLADPAPNVTVRLVSLPPGAEIFDDDAPLGTTPAVLKLSRAQHRLSFHLHGYDPVMRLLDLRRSTENQVPPLRVVLVERRAPQRKKAAADSKIPIFE
jgi:hypothetical protein